MAQDLQGLFVLVINLTVNFELVFTDDKNELLIQPLRQHNLFDSKFPQLIQQILQNVHYLRLIF